MALGIIYCVIGLAVLGFASDRLVVNAGHIATRFNISTVLIGAVVVGFGTSAPEMAVSGWAAANGDVDLGVGNIIGSNVANVTLVLGVAALITPVPVPRRQLLREFPACLAAVSVFALVVQGGVSRVEGVGLLVCSVLVLFLLYGKDLFRLFGASNATPSSVPSSESVPAPSVPPTPSASAPAPLDERSAWRQIWAHGFGNRSGQFTEHGLRYDIIWLLIGLAGTVGGAQLLVAGAQRVAEELDLGSGFVGLTVVAVGTSLPELVTASAASRRGMNGLLVGNVLGSNIFNSLAVGGLVGVVGNSALEDGGLSGTAVVIMLAFMVWMAVSAATKHKINRWESAVLLVGWFVSLPFIIS